NQLTGANFLDYYILYVYSSVDIADLKLAAFIQYAIKVIMTIPAILWSDKWGRRPFLIIGGLVMAAYFFVAGGLYHLFGEPNPVLDKPYAWLIHGHVPPCLYLAIAAFNLSWAPVAWIYSSEVVPLRIRATTVSLALTCRWTINFAVGFGILPLFRATKWGIFIMFELFNVKSSTANFVFAPETKQRTLEEVDEIFEHGVPLWKSFLSLQESNRLETMAREK
ncbi:general substrate transporter, partial [Lipomyces orientalis]